MINRTLTSSSGRDAGSTLIIVLSTLAVLAVVCGLALSRLGSTHQSAFRTAAWNATISGADSGVDVAMDRLRVAIANRDTWTDDKNALTASDASTWAGWTLATTGGVVSRTLPGTVTLLTTAGEGETRVMAQIVVDAPASLSDTSGSQWYRIRSRGVADLSGAARVGEKLDNSLLISNFTSTRRTSRLVEAIVKPRSAFQYSFLTESNMSINGSSGVTDSYDSRDNAKSTNGLYDPAKFQKNGNVASNSNSLWVGGYLWGSAAANGALPTPANHIYGERRSDFYEELIPVAKPTWTVYAASPSTVTTTTTILAGATTPTRYKLGAISGPLKISAPSPGQVSTVEIWVTGNITSAITADPGVTVRIWFEGNIALTKDTISTAGKAASMQLYGVSPATPTAKSISVKPSANFIAAIYAPAHDFSMQGSADFFGSFVAKTVASNGNASMHYDEALRDDTAFIKGYNIASWLEDAR